MEIQKTKNTSTLWGKEKKVGRLTLLYMPDFKTYYVTTVIKVVIYGPQSKIKQN